MLEIFLQNKGGSLAEFCAMWNLGKDNALFQVNFKACQVLKYIPTVGKCVAVSIIGPRDTAFVLSDLFNEKMVVELRKTARVFMNPTQILGYNSATNAPVMKLGGGKFNEKQFKKTVT
jgi:hypothetical protein